MRKLGSWDFHCSVMVMSLQTAKSGVMSVIVGTKKVEKSTGVLPLTEWGQGTSVSNRIPYQ